jgi:hypothetical protein
MNTEKETTGFSATQEQIDTWKAKHKNIYLVEVDGKVAYLKAPGRNELSYAATISKNDPMKFNGAIIDKCWLAGDEEIKTDDRLFMGVAEKLDQIIETAEATIKKL